MLFRFCKKKTKKQRISGQLILIFYLLNLCLNAFVLLYFNLIHSQKKSNLYFLNVVDQVSLCFKVFIILIL